MTDYFCYRKAILAVENGTVVEIKDLFDNTSIPQKIETVCSASDLRGNYVVIRHSKHEYCMIAHIKKGSFLLSASLPIWFDKIKNHTTERCSHISVGDIVENRE